MKLFNLDKSYNVVYEPQALLLKQFAAIIKRDRSTSKGKANKELAFIYFYCDIKSDYMIHVDLDVREQSIKADLVLDKKWKIDKVMQTAIDFYNNQSVSITAQMLKDSTYIASTLSTKMKAKVDDEELTLKEMEQLLSSIDKIPKVIDSLQKAEQAVLKEVQEGAGRLGMKEKALFEDGI